MDKNEDSSNIRSTNLIIKTIKSKDRPIIVPFGDMHYGSPNFNKQMFMKNLEWAYKNKNVYIIGMGDWLESSTRHSVGAGVYEQKETVHEQMDTIIKLFKPFADEGRLLGITNGNHEDRIYDTSGFDVSRVMAEILGVKYFHNGGFFKLRIEDLEGNYKNYHIYATHGSSSATLPYTKIKGCLKIANFIDADIYLMGHVHDEQVHTQEFMSIDNRSGMIVSNNKYFVLTGHYLDWKDSYAQKKNMIPSKQGTPKIKLHAKEKLIRVSL